MKVEESFFELYRLHAELADRVSQRREGANKLYVSLYLALILFFAAWLRFGSEGLDGVLIICALLGVCVSVSWFQSITSYRKLNDAKFKLLHEMEKSLEFSFFTREWEILQEDDESKSYRALTHIERYLPIAFGVFFGIAVILGLVAD